MMEEISVDETTASIDLDYNESENTDAPATITPASAVMDVSTSSNKSNRDGTNENDKEVIQEGVFETSTVSRSRTNDQVADFCLSRINIYSLVCIPTLTR